MSRPIHETFPREHGMSCGHTIMQHADHIDFLYEESFPHKEEEHFYGFYIVNTDSDHLRPSV